jgi:hypothetical protein
MLIFRLVCKDIGNPIRPHRLTLSSTSLPW